MLSEISEQKIKMSVYFSLKVKEVVQETPEAVTLVFESPDNTVHYKPGQFLTLIFEINGEKVRRSYSLCSTENIDANLAVTVKKVQGGLVSNFIANTIRQGSDIEIMAPAGNFVFDPEPTSARDIVLIGGGSGITPLMSILKAALYHEPLANVYLIYGNRNEKSVIFRNKLDQLQKEHGERFNVNHVLSQPQEAPVKGKGGLLGKFNKLFQKNSGRLNRSSILKVLESYTKLKPFSAEYFICGPEGLMAEAIEALKMLKIDPARIHKESFLPSGEDRKKGQVVPDNQTGTKVVTVRYQGSEYKFSVSAERSILEAALEQDIDLPFSCQSGMCTACMGKCLHGKVHLNEPDGLSQKEIDEGFVLTCVGHPVSDDVLIEID